MQSSFRFLFMAMLFMSFVPGHFGYYHHQQHHHPHHHEHDHDHDHAEEEYESIVKKRERGLLRKEEEISSISSSSRSCGTLNPTQEEQIQDKQNMAQYFQAHKNEIINNQNMNNQVIHVNVHWHTIYTTSGQGRTPLDQIIKTMQVMNEAFQGEEPMYSPCSNFQYGEVPASPFRFELIQILEHENDSAFNLDLSTSQTFRSSVRVGDCSTLNIFTGATTTLGFAYFPINCNNDSAANNPDDAVMLNYQALADGSIPNHNEGDTVTHEVGHWLGLYHTFNGGCTGGNGGDGDFVNDTPAESSPTNGCPIGRDSCNADINDGVDPIHNFMDYSYDCCMYKFTPDQITRMIAQVGLYRNLVLMDDTASPSLSPSISHPPTIITSDIPSNIVSHEPTSFPSLAPCHEANEATFQLELMTDLFGGETSWVLNTTTTTFNETILSGNDYQNQQLYIITNCIPLQCYTFTVQDSWGDGICCSNIGGQGYYHLYVNHQMLKQNGGDFGRSESISFCLDTLKPSTLPSSLPIIKMSSSPSHVSSISLLPSLAPVSSISPSLSSSTLPSLSIPSSSSSAPPTTTEHHPHPSTLPSPQILIPPLPSNMPSATSTQAPSTSPIPIITPSSVPTSIFERDEEKLWVIFIRMIINYLLIIRQLLAKLSL